MLKIPTDQGNKNPVQKWTGLLFLKRRNRQNGLTNANDTDFNSPNNDFSIGRCGFFRKLKHQLTRFLRMD